MRIRDDLSLRIQSNKTQRPPISIKQELNKLNQMKKIISQHPHDIAAI